MNDIDKRLDDELDSRVEELANSKMDLREMLISFDELTEQLQAEREEKERLRKVIETAAKELNDDFSQSELGNELFPVWHKLNEALVGNQDDEDLHENHVAANQKLYFGEDSNDR